MYLIFHMLVIVAEISWNLLLYWGSKKWEFNFEILKWTYTPKTFLPFHKSTGSLVRNGYQTIYFNRFKYHTVCESKEKTEDGTKDGGFEFSRTALDTHLINSNSSVSLHTEVVCWEVPPSKWTPYRIKTYTATTFQKLYVESEISDTTLPINVKKFELRCL